MGLYIIQQQRRLNKYVNTDSTIENQLPSFEETETYSQGQQEPHQRKSEDQEPQQQQQEEAEYQESQQEQPQQQLSTLQTHRSLSFSNQTPPPPSITGPSNLSAEAAAAWAYSKYALLFFVALLITWVSSHFSLSSTDTRKPNDTETSRSPHQQIEFMH